MNRFKLLLLILSAASYSVNGQDFRATRILDDVLILHPGKPDDIESVIKVGGTVTVVRTDSGIVVIDSFNGYATGLQAREKIVTIFPDLPFVFLICTHHHPDHVDGNAAFRDAVIVGHRNMIDPMEERFERNQLKYGHYDREISEIKARLAAIAGSESAEISDLKEMLAGWRNVKRFLETYRLAMPSLLISSDVLIKLGGKTFEVLYFGPAHTDNDIVILDREDRVLIMGDLFCHRKCCLLGPDGNAENWISLLDTLLMRRDEFDYVIPGHGGVALSPDELISQRAYLETLCRSVQEAHRKDLTLNEAKVCIRLEQYEAYISYDRLNEDVEKYWCQLESAKKLGAIPDEKSDNLK